MYTLLTRVAQQSKATQDDIRKILDGLDEKTVELVCGVVEDRFAYSIELIKELS